MIYEIAFYRAIQLQQLNEQFMYMTRVNEAQYQ